MNFPEVFGEMGPSRSDLSNPTSRGRGASGGAEFASLLSAMRAQAAPSVSVTGASGSADAAEAEQAVTDVDAEDAVAKTGVQDSDASLAKPGLRADGRALSVDVADEAIGDLEQAPETRMPNHDPALIRDVSMRSPTRPSVPSIRDSNMPMSDIRHPPVPPAAQPPSSLPEARSVSAPVITENVVPRQSAMPFALDTVSKAGFPLLQSLPEMDAIAADRTTPFARSHPGAGIKPGQDLAAQGLVASEQTAMRPQGSEISGTLVQVSSDRIPVPTGVVQQASLRPTQMSAPASVVAAPSAGMPALTNASDQSEPITGRQVRRQISVDQPTRSAPSDTAQTGSGAIDRAPSLAPVTAIPEPGKAQPDGGNHGHSPPPAKPQELPALDALSTPDPGKATQVPILTQTVLSHHSGRPGLRGSRAKIFNPADRAAPLDAPPVELMRTPASGASVPEQVGQSNFVTPPLVQTNKHVQPVPFEREGAETAPGPVRDLAAPAAQSVQAREPAPAAMMQDIARQMLSAATKAERGHTELVLNPRELGRVQINISVTDSGASVVVLAERSETYDMMRRHIDLLEKEFLAIGYSGVDLGHRGGADPDGTFGEDIDSQPIMAEEPVDGAVAHQGARPMTTGLDIRL